MIYLIGSLRNPEVPRIAQKLREELKEEVFDDWFAAGPEADDYWRDYEKARGRTYQEALQSYAARHVYSFDLFHLQRATSAVLALPAGKSGHLELGWLLGTGRPGYILLDSPDRWDVMYQFATGVHDSLEDLIENLRRGEVGREGPRAAGYERVGGSRSHDHGGLDQGRPSDPGAGEEGYGWGH